MPYNPGVFVGVRVLGTEPWDLLSLTVDGAPLAGDVIQAIAVREFTVKVPESLVSPRMAVHCMVQSVGGAVMSAALFGWSSAAADDPLTIEDERWRKLDGPESGDSRIELSGTFRP